VIRKELFFGISSGFLHFLLAAQTISWLPGEWQQKGRMSAQSQQKSTEINRDLEIRKGERKVKK
jgi:hypothetical protein